MARQHQNVVLEKSRSTLFHHSSMFSCVGDIHFIHLYTALQFPWARWGLSYQYCTSYLSPVDALPNPGSSQIVSPTGKTSENKTSDSLEISTCDTMVWYDVMWCHVLWNDMIWYDMTDMIMFSVPISKRKTLNHQKFWAAPSERCLLLSAGPSSVNRSAGQRPCRTREIRGSPRSAGHGAAHSSRLPDMSTSRTGLTNVAIPYDLDEL